MVANKIIVTKQEVKLLERSEIMNNINTSGMIWRRLKQSKIVN